MRSARGLAHYFENVVQPDGEEQREAIRAILDEAAPKFADAMMESRERIRSLSDSVRAELDPLLTDEQRQRLDEHMRIRRSGTNRGAPDGRRPEDDGRRRRPPPGGDRPPENPPPPPGSGT